MPGVLPWRQGTHGRVHLVAPLVPEHAQHSDVVRLAPRLLEDAAALREHDRVGGDDERRVRARGRAGLQRGLVDGEAFLVGGLQDVFEGLEAFGEVFGRGGGEDFEVREPDLGGLVSWMVIEVEEGRYLCEELFSPRTCGC